ncbi:hypothetical protein WA577_006603 [Blastocystis sp. JDR]
MNRQQNQNGVYSSSYPTDEPVDEAEDASLVKTCHLCGKAQCGQRKGRVRCAYCKRIFCLQQLYKKFKIKASVEDTDFKCPRCLGICCCVCNCQRPPPHVHCKVYKVRQNKKKLPDQPTLPIYRNPDIRVQPPPVKQENVISYPSAPAFPNALSLPSQPPEPILANVNDPSSSAFSYYSTDIPGIQHSDWLTQLNLQILDNGDMLNSVPSFFNASVDNSSSDYHISANDKFIDALRDYINRRQDLSSVNRHQMEKQLLESARKLQMKAAKSDLVFRMVDSFNRNTVQATVTWKLTNVFKEKKASLNVLPYFHTINRFYPTVLFSLETSDTKYEDQNDHRTLSITYFNTRAVKDIPSLCTCIALLDTIFQRAADVESEEKWTEPNLSWKRPENVDVKTLGRMVEMFDESKKKLEAVADPCRVCVSYSRSSFGMSFENLPLMCLIMKRVSTDYPSVIYSLERMTSDDQRVVFMLLFSENQNWVKILNGYESNIEVCREENSLLSRTTSQMLLDM